MQRRKEKARREAETSFGHYDRANAIRHGQLDYDPDVVTGHVDKIIAARIVRPV